MEPRLEPIKVSEEKQAKAKEEAYIFKSDCRIQTSDTGEVIKARFPKADDFYPRVHAALSRRIFQDEALLSQPDGVYCYIVFERDETPHIAFARTRSAWEFGTKHSAIVYALGLTELLFAGEFRKTDKTIEYNFLSGTYLADYNIELSPESYARIKTNRQTYMKALLDPLGFVAAYFEYPGDPDKSFIRTADMPVLSDEIAELTTLGATLSAYPTQKLCESEDSLARQIARLTKEIAKLEGELTTARASLATITPGRALGGRRRSLRRKTVRTGTRKYRRAPR